MAGESNYSPQKLEISYGFNKEREPVVFTVWRTNFAQNGTETRSRIYSSSEGQEIESALDQTLTNVEGNSIESINEIDVRTF